MNSLKPDLRNLEAKLPCVLYRFNVGTNELVYFSDTICEICGYTAEEILRGKRGWLDLIIRRDRSRVRKHIMSADIEPQLSIEYRIRHRSGKIVWILDQSTTLYAGGRPAWRDGILLDIGTSKLPEPEVYSQNRRMIDLISSLDDTIVRNNITEKKENENCRQQALQKVKESEQLKSAFLANISHEIRTPMNAIMGFAELLGMARPDLPDAKRVEFTRLILERSQDLLNVVNNILDISKIESGQISCLTVVGNVDEMLDRLLQRFRAEILHLKKSSVVVNVVNNLKREENNIATDFQRLTQILHNLLANASKFTREGSIEFGCRLLRPDILKFWVKDTGMGIPEDKLETVFLPFHQADESIHTKFGGSGLGLAISKGFVELLGGRIHAESTPGKGSTFYFTIPYIPVDTAYREAVSESLQLQERN